MNIEDFKIKSKIKMRVPNNSGRIYLCHIEGIIEGVEYKEMDMMIIYKYWSKYRKRWIWNFNSYSTLKIYNMDTIK